MNRVEGAKHISASNQAWQILVSQVLFQFLPSIFLGIIGFILNELANLFKKAAQSFQDEQNSPHVSHAPSNPFQYTSSLSPATPVSKQSSSICRQIPPTPPSPPPLPDLPSSLLHDDPPSTKSSGPIEHKHFLHASNTPASASVRTANLVARRINAYETFIATASEHQPLKLPIPGCDLHLRHDVGIALETPQDALLVTPSHSIHVTEHGEMSDHPDLSESFSPATALELEAPGGKESLQELIPEMIPQATPPFFSTSHLESRHNNNIPPLVLPRNESSASARTETYSSSGSRGLLTASNGKTTANSATFTDEAGSVKPVQSSTETKVGLQLSEQKKPRSQYHIVDEYESNMSTENGSTPASAERLLKLPKHMDMSPRQELKAGRAHRVHSAIVDARSGRRGVSNFPSVSKSMRGIPENKLFRQASVDVSSLQAKKSMGDRPKPRVHSHRFTSSGIRMTRSGKGSDSMKHSNSVLSVSLRASELENAGDWSECRQSTDGDEPRLTRRHASDMSFGVKARKEDMLPNELWDENDQGEAENEEQMGERLGSLNARGWMKRFKRNGPSREESKVASWNLLRRRKRSNMHELGSVSPRQSYDKGGSTNNPLRDRSFRFESELDVDTVFPLLMRICSECGFTVMMRRGLHKLKVEIPSDSDSMTLLVSILLNRSSGGKRTVLTVSRSAEDRSGRPANDIDSTGALLKRRLENHVEFIEDSFQSLTLEHDDSRKVRSRSLKS